MQPAHLNRITLIGLDCATDFGEGRYVKDCVRRCV